MTTLEISASQRRALRAQAHALHPVVQVGDRGLAPSVLKEIDHSLKAHGLIKIRVMSGERADREAILAQLCNELGCAAVHHLGKVLIIYRPQDETTAEPPKPPRPAPRRTAAPPPLGASAARIPRRPRPSAGSALSLRPGRRHSGRSTRS